MKSDEVLIHVTTWMGLEDIMLNKRSQSQNTTHCVIPFMGDVHNGQIHRETVD